MSVGACGRVVEPGREVERVEVPPARDARQLHRDAARPATGRSAPCHTDARSRLSATAAGQKSLNPAGPATTSSSSGSQGRSAAACASGTIATRRVPPIAVGTRRIGVSGVPAYGSPASASTP